MSIRLRIMDSTKHWIADYIRSHRREGTISIHVVNSKFNEDFRKNFKADPVAVVHQLIEDGFLKGGTAVGGFSIWLPEDEGKGQRFFRRRRKSDDKTDSREIKEGETPVTKVKATDDGVIDIQYTFEMHPHPKTGQTDILELIRYIIKALRDSLVGNHPHDGGYTIVRSAISQALVDVGVQPNARPDICMILQEMGLVKLYKKAEWGLLNADAANYMITPRAYLVARREFQNRRERNSEMARLRANIDKLQTKVDDHEKRSTGEGLLPIAAGGDQAVVASTGVDDQLVEALALLEVAVDLQKILQTQNAEQAQQIKTLEAKLAARPNDAELVKRAIEDRLALVKARLGA